jgi:hypothetical protein
MTAATSSTALTLTLGKTGLELGGGALGGTSRRFTKSLATHHDALAIHGKYQDISGIAPWSRALRVEGVNITSR